MRRLLYSGFALGALLVLALGASGCSVGYILTTAVSQGSLLLHRQYIDDVLGSDSTLSDKQRQGLGMVLKARVFSEKQGLDCGGSFLSYTHLDRPALSWVVAASPPLRLEPKTWWFPIVGTVPYKGFFEKEDALIEAQSLQKQNLETIIRGVTAFSTLGWFDDPVLTPMLQHDTVDIVNTVIHESVHSTLWISHSVAFNESLAHFVSLEGTIAFFTSPHCRTDCEALHQQALTNRSREIWYAQELSWLSSQLATLYRQDAPETALLKAKQEAFASLLQHYKSSFPDESPPEWLLGVVQRANNAEFLQERLYRSYFPCFETIARKMPPETSLRELVFTIKAALEEGPHRSCFDAPRDQQ